MMNVFPLRPFFVRSTLILGWIAGGAIAVLAAQHPAPPPPIEALAPEVSQSFTPPIAATDEEPPIEQPHDQMASLLLEVTVSDPACAYYSAFDLGEVELPRGVKSAVLEREFDFSDGCHWRSEEQLERIDGGRYRYTYRERALSCRTGARAAPACTRSGFALQQPDDE